MDETATETDAVRVETNALAIRVKALRVIDDETYVEAATMGGQIRGAIKRWKALWEKPKKAMDAAKKALLAEENAVLDQLAAAQAHIDGQTGAWNQKKRLEREQAQRVAEAAARKEAEDRRIAQAVQLEKNGKVEQAEKLIEKPIVVAPVVVASTLPKVAGLSMIDHWKFRITNESEIPREYLTPDTVKIGGVVRATKGTMQIPGVEIYNDPSPSQRAA
ncbi:MAG: hypothetical protein QME66_08180 [Candidatus Eisenbacteria bacterium]|nr:hypothetical protein [Candidatus Eisenbacteria bacterium]